MLTYNFIVGVLAGIIMCDLWLQLSALNKKSGNIAFDLIALGLCVVVDLARIA